MAKAIQKDIKKNSKPASESKNRGGVVRHALFALSVSAALVLVTATMDLHVFDLRSHLFGQSAYIAVLAIILSAAFVLLDSRLTNKRIEKFETALEEFRADIKERLDAETQGLDEKLAHATADLTSKMSTVSVKVDQFLGAEIKRLSDENQQFRKAQDDARIAASEKVSVEIQLLRARNEELESRINQWAVGSIEEKLNAKKLHVA